MTKVKKAGENYNIYNFEFPPFIEELRFGNFLFKRVSNYEEVYKNMMWFIKSSGGEFPTEPGTGSHQITATAELIGKKKKSVLSRAENDTDELDDILLLLTLFSGRNVFKWKLVSPIDDLVIIGDPRLHAHGQQVVLSAYTERCWKNMNTGELKSQDDTTGVNLMKEHREKVNIGFEKNINNALTLINSIEWQKEYDEGYFLFLLKSAIQRQSLDTSFIICWTIWEHVFAIKNRKRLDSESIESMGGDKKISFILNEYFLKEINETARTNIKRLKNTRNRLIHFGKKTDKVDFEEMKMFIKLTEQLVAIILDLQPSNAFNSFEKLEEFLNK